VEEFDTHIKPKLTENFSTPSSCDGTLNNLELEAEYNVAACNFQGGGDRIVVLVDNVCDENYWEALILPGSIPVSITTLQIAIS
jgi:hypothetical protein